MEHIGYEQASGCPFGHDAEEILKRESDKGFHPEIPRQVPLDSKRNVDTIIATWLARG